MLGSSQLLQATVAVGLCGLGLSIANVVLLANVSRIWYRTHRRYGTAVTLGSFCFGIVLLVENLLAVPFFAMLELNGSGSGPFIESMVVLRLLECVALFAVTHGMAPERRGSDLANADSYEA